MTSREAILRDIRLGLGREWGAPTGVPEVRLRPRTSDNEALVAGMLERVEAVGGTAVRVSNAAEAREYVARVTEGRDAIASNSTFLAGLGIAGITGVRTGFTTEPELRAACAETAFGISSANYALADTGTLVMISSAEEARFISLLPPVHIAIVPSERILSGLDDLFTRVPRPADISSSLVFITGPSRTGDIELELVRGVHGPGELHVVVTG